MSRPQTWFLLAMATMLTGSLSGMVLAGGDAKAGPKPLPPDVVKAWQNKGAEVVWMRRLDWGVLGAFPENERGAGSLPAFGFPGPRYRAGSPPMLFLAQVVLTGLPDPGVPFGLSLVSTQVTDEQLKELAGLKSLQSLSLGQTNVADMGLKELAGLKNLQALDLRSTQVTDAGMKELAVLKSLQWLSLSQTKVTDAGLKELAGLKDLRSLDLQGTLVTDAGVAGLKKALPGCKIQR